MNKHSRKNLAFESLKTALIVLLAASAVLLGWQTRLFNDFFDTIPLFKNVAGMISDSQATAVLHTGTITKEAARPAAIVITGEQGEHYGAKYDAAVKNLVYERISGVLSEAFGTIGAPARINEEVWRTALTGPGIYFEYITPVELSVLGGWFGARTGSGGGFPLRRVCLSFGGELNSIYFQDIESGLFYEAKTASAGGRTLENGSYGVGGTQFAFETGLEAADNAPYMLIIPESRHPTANMSIPLSAQETLDLILSAFGTKSQINSYYFDSSNSLNYVGTGFTVKIEVNGHAIYQRTETEAAEAGGLERGEMIERARVIIDGTLGKSCGDAEVYYSSVLENGENTYTVLFEYHLAGGRVHLAGNTLAVNTELKDNAIINAASVTFKDNAIYNVELYFKNFEITGEYITLLPEKQAMAAAQGEFYLCYTETGAGRYRPVWVKYDKAARST